MRSILFFICGLTLCCACTEKQPTEVWFGKMEVFKKGDQLWIKSYRSMGISGYEL